MDDPDITQPFPSPSDEQATYRALILEPDGRVLRIERIVALNDEEALARGKAMVDGHAVELWDGLRFIEYFPRE